MKKTIFKLSLFVIISILMSSCVSTNKGFQSSPVLSRSVNLDPIKADIKVNEKKKLSGESTSAYFLIFRVLGDNTFADGINYSTDANVSIAAKLNPLNAIKSLRLNGVRAAAAYKALENTDYDFLVHPNYVITTENYFIFQKYNVKVTGYGANYDNFRTEKQKVIITDNHKEYEFTK